jgi:hypothetical protein
MERKSGKRTLKSNSPLNKELQHDRDEGDIQSITAA